MIFIDGTWLWENLKLLGKEYGERYRIDYSAIRPLVKEILQKELNGAEVDIVRVNMFGSYIENPAPEDKDLAEAQIQFYEDRKKYDHFDVETFKIDFRGKPRRYRSTIIENEKETDRKFEKPKEKCVDVALATSMLFYAAVPYAYDIAVAIIGDIDYLPVLQHVRKLGKRVMILGIRGSCPKAFWHPNDPERIRDFPTYYLNDYLPQLQLKEEKRQCVYCRKWVSTFYRGSRFICPECLKEKEGE
jgi:uncharacterized LabA/DUF88 family protein